MYLYNLNLAMQKLPLDNKKIFLIFCTITLLIVILLCLETSNTMCSYNLECFKT